MNAPIRRLSVLVGLLFASLLVSFVTAPVDSLFGRPGLLVLAATTGGLAWWVARAAARRHGQR